jgi:hypothetical protein
LGEIYRRLHRYDKARFYFSRTLQAKELKSYPIVERRVRDAIMDARIAEDRSKRAE